MPDAERSGAGPSSPDRGEVPDSPPGRAPGRAPAHRPSRRQVIVDAAVAAFARKGFAETSVQDVAEVAGVVPTAVYYHFAGKDELFEVALQAVLAEVDEVVEAARPGEDAPEGDRTAALPRIIGAVWDWIETHPDPARILYSHLPGATRQAQALRVQFEERHIERAFDYARDAPPGPGGPGITEAEHAAARLTVRTLIGLLMTIHPLRMEDGPLSRRSPRALRSALVEVSLRMLSPSPGDQ